MPPQQRARKTAAPPPDTAQTPLEQETPESRPADPTPLQAEPGPICGKCFAGGWNALPADAPSAGCEHGTYTR